MCVISTPSTLTVKHFIYNLPIIYSVQLNLAKHGHINIDVYILLREECLLWATPPIGPGLDVFIPVKYFSLLCSFGCLRMLMDNKCKGVLVE